MLDALSDIVKNVAVIILLTTFLDMLLPNSSMQRFVKVIMGLFVMVAVLTPILNLFETDFELSAWQLVSLPEHKVETVLAQGEQIIKLQEEQALTEYKDRLEKQMEALIKLVPNVAFVQCQTVLEPVEQIGALARIEKVMIWVTPGQELSAQDIKPVEPVHIKIGSDNREESIDKKVDPVMKEKIHNIIANYYNLEKENIEIIFN
ncbi:MAG: stage III sporulation protein AF [Clostridia bacterium]|nr:stage III sporulation protein AF [Clostridia bacterium]